MRPSAKTAAALALVGAMTMTAADPSLARSRGWAAAGIGFAAGALIGAAAANAAYYRGPYGAYAYAPDYGYAPGYAYAPAYGAYAAVPRYRVPRAHYWSQNPPNREDQLTGSGVSGVVEYY